jgi:hypothetical protein
MVSGVVRDRNLKYFGRASPFQDYLTSSKGEEEVCGQEKIEPKDPGGCDLALEFDNAYQILGHLATEADQRRNSNCVRGLGMADGIERGAPDPVLCGDPQQLCGPGVEHRMRGSRIQYEGEVPVYAFIGADQDAYPGQTFTQP